MTEDSVLPALMDSYHAAVRDVERLRSLIAEHCMDQQVERFSYNGVEITFRPKAVWDEESLTPLREMFSPVEIEGMLNSPRERTFDKRKMNELAKRGGEVGRIINAARSMSPPQLEIKLPKD